MKVFLSYSHAHYDKAEAIAVAIAEYGHDVFFDRDSLPAGEPFHSKIATEIDGADLFVFLITPESVAENSFTRSELRLARDKWGLGTSRILPVLAAPTHHTEIPPFLRESVTLFKPEGHLAFEVSSVVAKLCQKIAAEEAPKTTAARGAAIATLPPKFIAYMVDRERQRDEIWAALDSKCRRVAFVVHGHEDDLHESVAERYVNSTLPKHLDRHDDSFKNSWKTVNWPGQRGGADVRLERLLRDLLQQFALTHTGRITDIEQHFVENFNEFTSRYRQPVTVCFNVRTDAWDADSEKIFDTVVRCLSRVRVPHDGLLSAFFFMKFPPPPKAGLMSLFSKPKKGAVERFIETLRATDPLADAGPEDTPVICLPELTPVSRNDVLGWAETVAPSVYDLLDRDTLVETVAKLFEDDAPERRYREIIKGLKQALAGATG